MKIAIMGAGAFGTALGGILAENGYDIDYYDTKINSEKLSEVLDGASMTLLAIPSTAVPYLLPHLPKQLPLIIATKGILSNKTFAGFEDYMILSGPGFAEDIKAHRETKLTATDRRIINMFFCDHLVFDYTDDEQGVLMCGALKNVYAIYAGILGLERGTSEHQKYIEAASEEMGLVLMDNLAKRETVDLYCGKDDLILTCGYPSRNYEFGDRLRADSAYRPEKTVEGVSALRRIRRGEIRVPENAPILRELIKISQNWDF